VSSRLADMSHATDPALARAQLLADGPGVLALRRPAALHREATITPLAVARHREVPAAAPMPAADLYVIASTNLTKPAKSYARCF
jgi:hypothetical protein